MGSEVVVAVLLATESVSIINACKKILSVTKLVTDSNVEIKYFCVEISRE